MAEERDEQELRETARLLVRSGLHGDHELQELFTEMVGLQMPGTDAVIMARAWLHAARRDWLRDAESWSTPTDHERLEAAFAECRSHAVAVLEGVVELGEVRKVVETSTPPLRGVLWFGRDAVLTAVASGVLVVGLRHGDGTPVGVEDDHLTAAVTGCLARHGVAARPLPGGLEVATWWRRRSPVATPGEAERRGGAPALGSDS